MCERENPLNEDAMNTDSPGPRKRGGEPKKLSLWGYAVGGWAALLAIIVSLFTFGWNVVDKFFFGPDPLLVPPETVNFVCHNFSSDAGGAHCPPDGFLVVRVNPLTFLNRASDPHAYVVRTTIVTISLLNAKRESIRTIDLNWEYFSQIAARSEERRAPVIPLRIGGRTSDSKEIEFYPRRTIGENGAVSFKNKILFNEFLDIVGAGDVKEIKLRFEATTIYPEMKFSTECYVPVDMNFVDNAATGEYVLFARECVGSRSG